MDDLILRGEKERCDRFPYPDQRTSRCKRESRMERDPATRSEQPIQETLFNFDEHDTVREGFLSRGRVTRFRKSQRPSCPFLRFSTISPSDFYSQFLENKYVLIDIYCIVSKEVIERSVKVVKRSIDSKRPIERNDLSRVRG